jgi:hypothetical protein
LPPIEGGDVITIQSQNVPLEDAVRNGIEQAAGGGSGEAGTKSSGRSGH